MNHIFTIIKKELRAYFNSPIAYIFITVYLVLSSFLFFRAFFIEGQSSMRSYFSLVPWLFLFLIPAATMRLFSEEKKAGTIETLLTWPVKEFEIVFGKFLASLIFISITLFLSVSIPISISFIGTPDFGVIITSYLGSILLAASYLSIGLYISSITENQIIAFIMAVAVSFAFFIIGEYIILFSLPSAFVPLFSYLGLGAHFSSISRGVIDSRDIIYYLSIIFIFLYLNVSVLKRR